MQHRDNLDPRARPPEDIQDVYKKLQKLKAAKNNNEVDILNEALNLIDINSHSLAALPPDLRQVFMDFLGSRSDRIDDNKTHQSSPEAPKVLKVAGVPGLYVYLSLLPPEVQLDLLDKLLHRDLSSAEHKTNVDLHYDVPRPEPVRADSSYFDHDSSSSIFQPLDTTIHKPISQGQFLNKKLRWVTLGGQYDWTDKVYPSSPPPPFPSDIKRLIERTFPMKAEAAIVNLYSPGDTLALHRDVSEECNQPLVSISLGCEGIFVVGLGAQDEAEASRMAVLRLRSGDAVLMSDQSRYAWHGVPKVLEGTCPRWMSDWPTIDNGADGAERFAGWKGWMASKRINLNIRQMFA